MAANAGPNGDRLDRIERLLELSIQEGREFREEMRASMRGADKDRGQAEKDRQQAEKDRQQAEKDRQQAQKDRQQAQKDRQQAEKDRAGFRAALDTYARETAEYQRTVAEAVKGMGAVLVKILDEQKRTRRTLEHLVDLTRDSLGRRRRNGGGNGHPRR